LLRTVKHHMLLDLVNPPILLMQLHVDDVPRGATYVRPGPVALDERNDRIVGDHEAAGFKADALAPLRRRNVLAHCRRNVDERKSGRKERAKRPQVPAIRFVLDLLGSLQKLGDTAEALVVEKKTKRFQAELAVADVFVAVDARPQRLLRIVQVKQSDIPHANRRVELLNRTLVRDAAA